MNKLSGNLKYKYKNRNFVRTTKNLSETTKNVDKAYDILNDYIDYLFDNTDNMTENDYLNYCILCKKTKDRLDNWQHLSKIDCINSFIRCFYLSPINNINRDELKCLRHKYLLTKNLTSTCTKTTRKITKRIR